MKTLHRTFDRSEQMLDRALRSIPLGTQTFSKSITQYPRGVSPFYIARGEGSKVWDVDGNQYIDLVNALAAVTLGYNDPDVTRAVVKQLESGTVFSLPHELEIEVAEALIQMVPCAELVRFGKNGSDATSGAIRVARAFTGKDHVAVCGYHGWHDWYIGSTARNLGVPAAVRELTHTWTYNDLSSLETLFAKHQIAAVIMEPMNVVEPAPGFLSAVKEIAHAHGALLVFDEVITGFRYANGGAQEYLGVTPDLACFGKGLANGYPLSALAGRADVMSVMDKIFFSSTFGGETLSLAAAKATLTKLQTKPILAEINSIGQRLMKNLVCLVEKHQLSEIVSISGHPSWSFVVFKEPPNFTAFEIKTLFLQEMFARGVICLGTNNISHAFTEEDLSVVSQAYDEAFGIIKKGVFEGTLLAQLRCEPLQPLFKVR